MNGRIHRSRLTVMIGRGDTSPSRANLWLLGDENTNTTPGHEQATDVQWKAAVAHAVHEALGRLEHSDDGMYVLNPEQLDEQPEGTVSEILGWLVIDDGYPDASGYHKREVYLLPGEHFYIREQRDDKDENSWRGIDAGDCPIFRNQLARDDFINQLNELGQKRPTET